MVRRASVALVERQLQPPPPFGVDERHGFGESREFTVGGMGDGQADPRFRAVGEPDPVALVERMPLELEVVEHHEDFGGRHHAEVALPGEEGGLHQCDPRAVHVTPSAAKSVDREV
ncbi:MAG: hypothetical protein QOG65_3691 [Actinomycetota bacterium]|nr:hypothetical protein [Actinomycetota bacterium]